MTSGARRGLGPDFGRLFSANLASSLADGIARTAAPLLAVQLTDDPLLVSGIAALALLPWLLFAIPAGMIVDRFDRRRSLAVANTLRAMLAVGLMLLVATGSLTIWWLYLVVFLYGAGETVYDGAVRAVVPGIVGRADLPRANGRIEAGEVVVQNFLSGPFTSLLFAVTVLVPLGVNAAAFAVAAGLALALPRAASGRQFAVARPDDAPHEPWHRALAEGFRFIFADRMLTVLLLVSTVAGLCFSAGTSNWVLYLLGRLDLPEAWFGVFMLSGAVGAIAGSFLAQPLKRRWGTGRAMALGDLVAAAALAATGLVPALWFAAIAYFVTSLAVTVWNVLVMSLRQSIIPGRLLGRVHGSWRTILWGTMPVGSLLGGFLGRIDLAAQFLIAGGIGVAVSLLAFRFLSRLPNPEDVDNGDRPVGDGEPGPTHPGTPA